ncbi:MAG: hypothetical protein ABI577_13295 [bacterium]
MTRTASPLVWLLAGSAFLAAVVAALYLGLADTYSSESCSAAADGVTRCTQSGETLAEANGNGVLWLLLIPILMTTAVLVGAVLRAPGWLTWSISGLFASLCVVSALTIGGFFFPAAVLALAAAAAAGRAVRQTPHLESLDGHA